MAEISAKTSVDVKTHMMFQGDGESAVALYSTVFHDFQVESVERYGEGEPGAPGAFKMAHVTFAGHRLTIFDSPPVHAFTFTPSISLFVDFETLDALNAAFAQLSEGGQVMMPLGDYGFSAQLSWVADRYGVSWQLNLPRDPNA